MGLQKEVWAADIAANLFPDNSFLRRSKNDDVFVDDKWVHLPQSGAIPNVEINRVDLPAPVRVRQDTIISYMLNEFTTDPDLIRDIDETETSYDLRSNVLEDHNGSINASIGNYMPYTWATSLSERIKGTSGTTNRPSAAPGATGNRKRLIKEDLLDIKALFDAEEIPQDSRFMLLDSVMYNDLLRDKDLMNKDFVMQGNINTGSIAMVYGFEIFVRSFTGRYATGSSTPKAPTAANAVEDNSLALFWHANFVRAALGAVKVFANEDEATMYGSVFSALVRAGGSKRYATQKGVACIVETAA